MRGYEIYSPEPSQADDRTVAVTVRELRELSAGIDELLRFAEGMDNSDLGEEPDDLLFLRGAADRLDLLLGRKTPGRRVEGSRQLGMLDY